MRQARQEVPVDQPTADDEGSVRRERVEPAAKNRVRDALHIGVEVPMKYMVGLLLVGAFNGGAVWYQFSALLKASESLQASHREVSTSITKIEQKNFYQDEKLADHESRIRTVERTKP